MDIYLWNFGKKKYVYAILAKTDIRIRRIIYNMRAIPLIFNFALVA